MDKNVIWLKDKVQYEEICRKMRGKWLENHVLLRFIVLFPLFSGKAARTCLNVADKFHICQEEMRQIGHEKATG